MKTNHMNIVDSGGRVYCHRLGKIVKLNQEHFDNHCKLCPYFTGTASMKGVECKYDDKSGEEFLQFRDSVEAEKHSKMMYVRMGLKTEEEVIDEMDGYTEYPNEEDETEGEPLIEDEQEEETVSDRHEVDDGLQEYRE